MAVILVAMTSFILLFKICYKFNLIRKIMFISLIIIFLSSIIGLRNIFELVILEPILVLYILFVFLIDIGLFNFLSNLCERKIFKYEDKLIK